MEYLTSKNMSVTFFGHRHMDNLKNMEEKLAPILRKIMLENSYVEFYIGRNGEFDECVASIVKRVQKEVDRKNSSLILVLPYAVADIEYYAKYYDEIIIPEKSYKSHPKAAITVRNRWMIDNSDIVIVNVERKTGGAYRSMLYAQKIGKSVWNMCGNLI